MGSGLSPNPKKEKQGHRADDIKSEFLLNLFSPTQQSTVYSNQVLLPDCTRKYLTTTLNYTDYNSVHIRGLTLLLFIFSTLHLQHEHHSTECLENVHRQCTVIWTGLWAFVYTSHTDAPPLHLDDAAQATVCQNIQYTQVPRCFYEDDLKASGLI